MTLVLHAHLWGDRQSKHDWLNSHEASDTQWAEARPHSPSYWFVPRDSTLQAEYEAGWKITDAMPVNSVGIVTARDHLTIQFTKDEMWDTAQRFASMEPESARKEFTLGRDVQDWKVKLAQADLAATGLNRQHVVSVLYRPFDTRFTYYTGSSRGFICRPRPEVMRQMLAGGNIALVTCRQQSQDSSTWALVGITSWMIESCAVSNKTKEIGYLFSLRLFDRHARPKSPRAGIAGTQAGEGPVNLAPEFVKELSGRLKMSFIPDGRGDLTKTFGPEDVFAYIYGVFHSPTYRTRYAEFLKIDFPRVPLTSNADLFRALCRKGQELVDLHLMRDERINNPSFWRTSYPVAGAHDVTCVDYHGPGDSAPDEDQPLETGRVYINKKQPKRGVQAEYFDGVPPDVWEFRIGGYQVLDHWLKERKRHKRCLTIEDIEHFQKVVAVLRETIRLMREIDEVIEAHGGWPDAFQKGERLRDKG